MNPSLRRFAVPMVLLFALGLAAPSAGFAAPRNGGLHWPDWLGFFSRLWAPQGCGVEPVGICSNGNTSAPRDAGCVIEPVGRCANASTPPPRDQGCGLDPVGHCID